MTTCDYIHSIQGCLSELYPPSHGPFSVRKTTSSHKIKSDTGLWTDMGSFFMSQVMAARPQAQKAVLSFLHSPILLAILWPAVTEFIRNGFMLIQNPASHLILVTLVTSLMHILENGLMTSKIRWTVFGVNLTVCNERLNVFRVRLITFSVKKKVYVMKD